MPQARVAIVGNNLYTRKCLDILQDLNYKIVAVIQTNDENEDLLDYCDLALYCHNNNITYRKFDNLQASKALTYIKGLTVESILFLGYSGSISHQLLGLPALGCIASYSGILPEYSGHNPICQTIADGLGESGLTFYKVSKNHPFGNIILQRHIPVTNKDDAGDLFEKICDLSLDMLGDLQLELELGLPQQTTFDDSKIKKFWGLLTLDGCKIEEWDVPCSELVVKIRSITYPFKGAWFAKGSRKIIAWKAREGKYKTDKKPGTLVYYDENHYVVTTKTVDLDIIKYDITNAELVE